MSDLSALCEQVSRELGVAVQATHSNLVELLTDVYADYLDGRSAELIVTQVPDGLEQIIVVLKPLTSIPTGNLLASLRILPATFPGLDSSAAIRVVRQLPAIGVACHLSGVRDRRDD